LRFLYTTDLHGDMEAFESVLGAAREHGAAAIVNGGDLLPHGFKNALALQREFLALLDAHLARVRRSGIAVHLMFGNDDARALEGRLDAWCDSGLAGRLDGWRGGAPGAGWLDLGDWQLIGVPWVPDPPFRLKDWCRHDDAERGSPPQFGTPLVSTDSGLMEAGPDGPAYLATLPTLEEELRALPRPRDPSRAILVAHAPPHDTGLDALGDGRPAGSRAVRRFVESSGFPLSLHGHIHEAPGVSGRWFAKVGSTTAVNPGAIERPGWVLVDLERRELRHRTMGEATF
jgi:Icc-related predicted phosphoesterase